MPGRAPAGHSQPAAQDPALAARLRTARLAALLRTGGHGPQDARRHAGRLDRAGL